VISLINFGFFV